MRIGDGGKIGATLKIFKLLFANHHIMVANMHPRENIIE